MLFAITTLHLQPLIAYVVIIGLIATHVYMIQATLAFTNIGLIVTRPSFCCVSDPARNYRQRAPTVVYDNIGCHSSTRLTSLCAELFVVKDRRPRGNLLIAIYDTSVNSGQVPPIDELPFDADPFEPEESTPTLLTVGFVPSLPSDDGVRYAYTYDPVFPADCIALPGDVLDGAEDEETGDGVEEEVAVDWLHNLAPRGEIAELERCLLLNSAIVGNSQTIHAIKVNIICYYYIFCQICILHLRPRNSAFCSISINRLIQEVYCRN
jgi:hypothetical protein